MKNSKANFPEPDTYGRHVQSSEKKKFKLFVHVYSMKGEYPFMEINKKIDQKWIEFETYCTDPMDIDEELNVSNKNHSISYEVVAIKD